MIQFRIILFCTLTIFSIQGNAQKINNNIFVMSNGEVIDCELSLDININNNYLFLLGYRKFDEIWSSQDYILGMNMFDSVNQRYSIALHLYLQEPPSPLKHIVE